MSTGIQFKPVSKAELDTSHDLIAKLIHFADTKAKLNGDKRPTVKCTTLAVPDHASAQLRSWKMDEFSYGKPDKPLPTNARGLFSYTSPAGRHEIVIRGYDKFFNTGEVRATEWPNIESQTRGPYDVTLKQNGCIIFIGALPDHTILVTSKHSLGQRQDMAESHSQRGKKWLHKHLLKAGKTEQELASILAHNKITIVCELCDDEFEEHILGYPPELSGLYLHGINRNTSVFSTYPISEVNEFAKQFGFLSNSHLVLPNVNEMRKVLQDCAKTGTYEGTEIEGFVIRTKLAGQDFFFKYKFEEPYLLFRQWREVTKQVINGREARFQKHKGITKEYLTFIAPMIRDPITAKRYLENHGIISLRQKFLDHHGGDLADIVAKSASEPQHSIGKTSIDWPNDRFVIVPIATIGCGKTTIAVALQKLFGFGHIQNDNILGKRPALQFAKNVVEAFKTCSTRVVVADRNNHMLHERESLIRDIRALSQVLDPPVQFIALYFTQTPALRAMTTDRVLKRGDNHQSIRAATMSAPAIQEIMDGFHKRFQPLDTSKAPDSNMCHVVEVDPLAGSLANLTKLIDALFDKGLIARLPTQSALEAAVQAGMNYAPTVYKHMTSHPAEAKTKQIAGKKSQTTVNMTTQKTTQVNYFALRIIDFRSLVRIIDTTLENHPQHSAFWKALKSKQQVQSEFHVTLIHASDKTRREDVWQQYAAMKLGGYESVQLVDLVFDDRVMAITIDSGGISLPHTNEILHITIGTADKSIKPFEANAMLRNASGKYSMDSSALSDRRPVTRVPIQGTIKCELKAYL